MRKFKGYIDCYIILVFAFTVLLWITFLIPDSFVKSDQSQISSLIDRYDGGDPALTEDAGSVLDIHTDGHMYDRLLRNGQRALYTAMDSNGYARYWHGYLIFLRPLTVFFSYREVLYIFMIVLGMTSIYLMQELH